MSALSLDEAMRRACDAVKVAPPKRRCEPGRWTRTDSLGKNGRNDAAVLIDDDQRGGFVYNYQTSQGQKFRVDGANDNRPADPKIEARRRAREAERESERRQVERICADLVQGCRTDVHPYLKAKGFPEEPGLVCDDPRDFFPSGRFGDLLGLALPEGQGPFLIIPGRVGKTITTVQFITPDGAKKNILRGVMNGASHRIASGRDTWVCEGIATAMTVRAALRLLRASVTVLSAFSASNVGQVAESIAGSRIAADHDKPVETLEGLGAGEFYARRSGRNWTMPKLQGDDFNDMHQREGLRAVALHLREVMMQ
jgi:putative DNA primase/helicase